MFGKKPGGGFGGNGGDVYLEGVTSIYDLSFLNQDLVLKAENGERGGANNSTGKFGSDLTIKVPLITHVYNKEGVLVLTVSEPGEKKLLLKGGRGGLGNYYFRKKGIKFLETSTPGNLGDVLKAKLVLELFSDIIFIGYPNAGKSSILNAITKAKSKVAAYEFTTLNPQLGMLNNLTLMDLPGLIVGTAEGKGLGTAFVKHTKASRLLAHTISLDLDVVTQYKEIRSELKRINEELYLKPEVVILTKSDLVTPEIVKTKIKQLKKYNKNIFVCSVYDYDSLEELKIFLETAINNIIAVSSEL